MHFTLMQSCSTVSLGVSQLFNFTLVLIVAHVFNDARSFVDVIRLVLESVIYYNCTPNYAYSICWKYFRLSLRMNNIKAKDFISHIGPNSGASVHGGFLLPNLRRTGFFKYMWQQQFVDRQAVFSLHHVGYLGVCLFFIWVGWFNTAPKDRQDKYYMNSDQFRLRSALANPDTRPAFKIAQEQAKIRAYYRGFDDPFAIDEAKDLLFKLRDKWFHYNLRDSFPSNKFSSEALANFH